MAIKLTWIESPIGPTEMWVEARTARDYESQGFKIVDFEPSPAWCSGCYGGRALIRKPGSECIHIWSPELAALHKFVCNAHDRACRELRIGPVWRRMNHAHHLLFTEYKYHEKLMYVEKYSEGPLEVVQDRVVTAIRDIASREKGDAARRLRGWADAVNVWGMS